MYILKFIIVFIAYMSIFLPWVFWLAYNRSWEPKIKKNGEYNDVSKGNLWFALAIPVCTIVGVIIIHLAQRIH
jgi:hypothetical protein